MALRYVLAVLLLGACSAGVGTQQPHADEQSAGIDLQPPKPIVITDVASNDVKAFDAYAECAHNNVLNNFNSQAYDNAAVTALGGIEARPAPPGAAVFGVKFSELLTFPYAFYSTTMGQYYNARPSSIVIARASPAVIAKQIADTRADITLQPVTNGTAFGLLIAGASEEPAVLAHWSSLNLAASRVVYRGQSEYFRSTLQIEDLGGGVSLISCGL